MNNTFIMDVMDRIGFPAEAKDFFVHLNVSPVEDEFAKLITSYQKKQIPFHDILDQLTILAEKSGIHPYSMHLYFLLHCSQHLYHQYQLAGVSETIYWDTITDLKYKLMECHRVKGVWGIFTGPWFERAFHMTLFALGRFQYERQAFQFDQYEKNGFLIEKGRTVYNIHIPSSDPLLDHLRIDSYQRAYEFYRQELGDDPMVIVCNSWLLYPKHYDYLPPTSNIIKFMNDFDIISYTSHDEFNDYWRVFGKDNTGNPEDLLPLDTSLKRAYATMLSEHIKTGNGFGILLFDGEKIIR